MRLKLAAILLLLVRASGVAALVLGGVLWSGQGGAVLHAHMGCGGLVVLALWGLAALAWRTARGTALLASAWGVVVPALGWHQLTLLPGEHHWVVRVVHLLVGLAAVILAERLSGALRRAG